MKRKVACVFLSVLLMLGLSACGAQVSASSTVESGESELPPAAEGRQVRMISGEVEVLITLNDSQAAADFASMLPLELTLIERNGFAKGMTLPRKLSTEEPTTREYAVGDFGYWADGPDLAIFYDDIYEQTIVPIIPMGKADSNAENMRNPSGTVRLELMPEDEEENQNE